MSTEPVAVGPRPPQQARSRAVLRRVLASAEHVLVTGGLDNFTMAAVAEHAGVSIGALYRRFSGKDQLLYAVKDRLLTQLEEDLSQALVAAAGQGIGAVVDAYTGALADAFAAGSAVYPLLLQHAGASSVERGRRTLDAMERLFVEAASGQAAQIRHRDPAMALVVLARTIAGACIHRTASLAWWPDISWESWQAEVTAMGIAYLATDGPPS